MSKKGNFKNAVFAILTGMVGLLLVGLLLIGLFSDPEPVQQTKKPVVTADSTMDFDTEREEEQNIEREKETEEDSVLLEEEKKEETKEISDNPEEEYLDNKEEKIEETTNEGEEIKETSDHRKEEVEENSVSPWELGQLVCSVSEYPFQDQKEGEKLVEWYEKVLNAGQEEFICLTEEKDVHLFQSSEVWYQKSLDINYAPFRYYGEVNKEGNPDGMGVLVRNWEEFYQEDTPYWIRLAATQTEGLSEEIYMELIYIGEFRNGFKEGYGINFGAEGLYDMPVISYEGEFSHGRPEGEGNEYLGLAGDTYDGTLDDRLLEAFCVEYSDMVDNKLRFPMVAEANLYYKGSYKAGGREGAGTEYWTWGERQELCPKYEGGFKDSHYSGAGTLYFEDGTIQYKGEFKNGKYDGKGILYDEQGNVLHEGKFKDGDVG